MKSRVEKIDRDRLILILEGRLDSVGADQLADAAQVALQESHRLLAVDMQAISYISSAALRVFLLLNKQMVAREGVLVLFALQEYSKQVLDVAGFTGALAVEPSREAALALMPPPASMSPEEALPGGGLTVEETREAIGTVDVLGDINDVLYARVTPDLLASKPFFQTEYSLGLGALGHRPEDYLAIMGEAITIGGTMVWLPTDGQDTPDFLIPKKPSEAVMLRTGFNVCVRGGFNEIVRFTADAAEGMTMSELYRALFDRAKKQRPDFKGALGLALRAECGRAYGSGVTRSPIPELAPEDGRMIIDPAHFSTWFEIDTEPRHRDVTALICGVGVDLSVDRSGYNQTYLNRAFYINPSNQPAHQALLHNHAVFFNPLPMPAEGVSLESAIQEVVEAGNFMDMRHLLDQTTITSALIGINYVQDFREDDQR